MIDMDSGVCEDMKSLSSSSGRENKGLGGEYMLQGMSTDQNLKIL